MGVLRFYVKHFSTSVDSSVMFTQLSPMPADTEGPKLSRRPRPVMTAQDTVNRLSTVGRRAWVAGLCPGPARSPPFPFADEAEGGHPGTCCASTRPRCRGGGVSRVYDRRGHGV
jgi:hypothetical protein